MIFNIKEEDCRKIGVYSITNNINNKLYVGSTTTNFKHRYMQYKSGFLRKLDNQPVLYRAFRKYGFENFTFEILCITDKENALTMEQFYINKGVDYNSCLIAGSLAGFRHPYNSKTRMVRGGEHHCAIGIDMYSLEGEYIKSFDSITDAQESTNIKSKSNISQCCKGKVFSAGGFRFSLKGKNLNNRIKREFGTKKIALSKNSFYKEFHSQKECSEYLKRIGYLKCNQGLVSAAYNRNGFTYNYKIIKL